MNTKICLKCKNEYTRKKGRKSDKWKAQKYCSYSCAKTKEFNRHYKRGNTVFIISGDNKIKIDIEDLQKINTRHWCVANGYAKNKQDYMHWVILYRPDNNLVTDHINRNRLDNRKCNLRIVNRTENSRNCPLKSKCGFRGISRYNKKYRATLTCDGRTCNLGTYATKKEAIEARLKGEIKYWGRNYN